MPPKPGAPVPSRARRELSFLRITVIAVPPVHDGQAMQPHDWIELFRLIPADQHSTLVLTTASGIDLNLDIILRTEPNYLVFRGRVSGITDEGRVFFLPYGQIDFFQINRTVKEVEIRRLFGEEPEERFGVNDTGGSHQSGSFPRMTTQTG